MTFYSYLFIIIIIIIIIIRFLRSFLLFWPLRISNTSLNILIDQEEINSPHLSNLKNFVENKVSPRLPGGVKFSINVPSPFYRRGADRQQLLMFWADNFTNSGWSLIYY